MSKLDDVIAKYADTVTIKLGITDIDHELLVAVTKSLGPLIYLDDPSRVSCTDQDEKDRVRNNFLIKKLGLPESPDLDAGIDRVCQKMGSANRDKWRAVFYYLLVQHFEKRDFYIQPAA
ncbi:MAG: hypothetical protein RL329_790 [Bacteroidota bacterium]